MKREEIIRSYYKSLEEGDLQKVLSFFSENAQVTSPLNGKSEASDFYQTLLSDSKNSKIDLINIFMSLEDPDCYAARFVYKWEEKSVVIPFQCIHIFEFEPKSQKLKSLSIIYDSHHTRSHLELAEK